MSSIFDFNDDPNGEILKVHFRSITDVPDMIKEAKFLPLDERVKLANTDFALVALDNEGNTVKKFPIVDPGNTYLSGIYFMENIPILPEEHLKTAAQNLLSAYERFNLNPPEEILLAALGVNASSTKPVEKVAYKNYCLPNRYPIDSYAQVEAAIDYFEKYASEFSPEQRREYCANLQKRADELNIETSEKVAHYGSSELSPLFTAHIEQRMALVGDEGKDMYEKVASFIPHTTIEEGAEILRYVDDQLGLTNHPKLTDPYAALLKTAIKKPSSKKTEGFIWRGPLGDTLTGDDLVRMSQDDETLGMLTKKYGESFVTQFRQSPLTVFNSLPDPHKAIVSRIGRR